MGPWIALDLETTGLSPAHDIILELGAMRVDSDLRELSRYERVYQLPAGQHVGDYVRDMHTTSGLLVQSRRASILAQDDDTSFRQWLQDQGANPDQKATLIGFSVHFDLNFLRSHMPRSAELLSHRVIDASVFKSLGVGWGYLVEQAPGGPAHRSIDDCQDALEYLRKVRSLWDIRHLT